MFKHFKPLFLMLLLTIPIYTYAYSDYIVASGANIGIKLKSDGIIVMGNYDNSNRCFRPIVALNSSISATQNEEGIWELESKK